MSNRLFLRSSQGLKFALCSSRQQEPVRTKLKRATESILSVNAELLSCSPPSFGGHGVLENDLACRQIFDPGFRDLVSVPLQPIEARRQDRASQHPCPKTIGAWVWLGSMIHPLDRGTTYRELGRLGVRMWADAGG